MITALLDWILHRTVRRGDVVELRYDDGTREAHVVTAVEGWGRYAAVRLAGRLAVRRDLIRRDEHGVWRYRYGD